MARSECRTQWLEYFCDGVAESFENVKKSARDAAVSGAQDRSAALRRLDPRQRTALELFGQCDVITSQDIAARFRISQRAARNLLSRWVGDGFLLVADPARKSRKYRLAKEFQEIIS
jgi:DNA-directed RNA polymerase specialized sigma24 family protein